MPPVLEPPVPLPPRPPVPVAPPRPAAPLPPTPPVPGVEVPPLLVPPLPGVPDPAVPVVVPAVPGDEVPPVPVVEPPVPGVELPPLPWGLDPPLPLVPLVPAVSPLVPAVPPEPAGPQPHAKSALARITLPNLLSPTSASGGSWLDVSLAIRCIPSMTHADPSGSASRPSVRLEVQPAFRNGNAVRRAGAGTGALQRRVRGQAIRQLNGQKRAARLVGSAHALADGKVRSRSRVERHLKVVKLVVVRLDGPV